MKYKAMIVLLVLLFVGIAYADDNTVSIYIENDSAKVLYIYNYSISKSEAGIPSVSPNMGYFISCPSGTIFDIKYKHDDRVDELTSLHLIVSGEFLEKKRHIIIVEDLKVPGSLAIRENVSLKSPSQ